MSLNEIVLQTYLNASSILAIWATLLGVVCQEETFELQTAQFP